MKAVILTMFLVISQAPVPVPGKAANNRAGTGREAQYSGGTHQKPAALPVLGVNTDKSPTTAGDRQQKGGDDTEDTVGVSKLPPVSITRDWVDWGYWLFTLLLVVVGAGQVYFLFGTLRAIERQGGILERQTKATEEAANSAKDSAGAAISTERAWLIPAMQQELLPCDVQLGAAKVQIANVVCTIKNYGKTPAWVTGLCLKRHLLENGEGLSGEPNYTDERGEQEQPKGEMVLPPEGFVQQVAQLLRSQVDDIRAGNLALYVYGYVGYRDAFNRGRETRFCFAYHVPRGSDLRPESFYLGGPPAYNHQT